MAEASPWFEDVEIGDALPVLAVSVGRTQLFLFSAATNNAHRIHYDQTWAVDEEGLKDIVVHGPLHGALAARSVTDWAGPDAHMTNYAMRHKRPAFPGDELRFKGQVTAKRHQGGKAIVEVDVEETNAQGEVLGSAMISVALPLRAKTA